MQAFFGPSIVEHGGDPPDGLDDSDERAVVESVGETEMSLDEEAVVLDEGHPKHLHRAPQVVSLLTDRTRVVAYMQALHDAGETRLPSKAVAKFPALFTGNQKANLQKSSRWWKERERHMAKQRRSVVAGSAQPH
ncbi:hypothetical protein PF005_g548 [Phytophthora fragariae]|uniref:Uncharacterized protein n=1 Tax=Phytophthora fragariae TaxID=53985 RepID=A0A6A3FZK3_9STRA|nr:hypothetical protein PF003_g19182 [Phytophthora fragariae]KAE8949856.1 hypothetical protein PF009_g602 [Phytophthora fragariae]KAE9140461.1 hypothetical protein PF007_g635 [Phytophthora fragariae]KAE9153211.1 hypothetical protein PF006_g2641 [Phytophthora fragariae]KAE9237665.1 hypothetical protein PF005_g548 [Phytophthora fragariae]